MKIHIVGKDRAILVLQHKIVQKIATASSIFDQSLLCGELVLAPMAAICQINCAVLP